MKKPKPKASDVDVRLGLAVRDARLAAARKQSDISSILGVTSQQWSKYELGIDRISASRLYEIAQALDMSMDDFFIDDLPNEK